MTRETDFSQFVEASGTRLMRTSLLLVGDVRDAEDLVQVSLEKAYRNWGKICRTDHPEAYVRRILVNSAMSRWRRIRSRPGRTLDHEGRCPMNSVMPKDEQLNVRDALIRALAEIPDFQKAVLVLRYYCDLSEADVAALLKCSVGTVKSRASRGLAQLRLSSNLADFNFPPPPTGRVDQNVRSTS